MLATRLSRTLRGRQVGAVGTLAASAQDAARRAGPVASAIVLALLAGGFSSAGHANQLLVTNATIVTLEEDRPEAFTGYLLVGDDGRIATVAPGSPPAGLPARETYDAAGKIVMPGFLSGHSHLWQSAFRGIAADQWVSTWVQGIHRTFGPHFTDGDQYAFTLHGSLDYLRYGITTIYNYSQNVGPSPEMYEEQFQAQYDSGTRFIFGYSLSPQPSVEEARQRFETFLERVNARPENPRLLKTAIATGGGLTPEFMETVLDLMQTRGLDVQIHFLEPPSSRHGNLESFNVLDEAGLVGPGMVFAHFIHTNDEILNRSGRAGAGMIWNPLSNGRLASGLPDIPKYLAAGVAIGMGIDGQASADISDPFENMRMGLYGIRKLYQDARIMQPIDMLRLHTIGTAEVLGVADQVGTLTPGKFADFLVVDPSDFDTGPVTDVYATLVFASKISNLERVYVGGELVVERGRPLAHDFKTIAAEVRERNVALRQRVAHARDAAAQANRD